MPGVPCPPRATAASDIVSYAFQNVEQNGTELDEPLYIDADHPSRFLSSIQVHTLVRKLVAGLDSVGLCKGDRVVVHLFNSVSTDTYALMSHTKTGLYSTSIPRSSLGSLAQVGYTSDQTQPIASTSSTTFSKPQSLLSSSPPQISCPQSSRWRRRTNCLLSAYSASMLPTLMFPGIVSQQMGRQ